MFCSYCGYELNDKKANDLSVKALNDKIIPDSDAEVKIICPRCGTWYQ